MFLVMLLPTLYDLTNTFWIGHFINLNSFVITEQCEHLSDTIEIVNEPIPFGVLALVAQNYHDKEKIASIMKAALAKINLLSADSAGLVCRVIFVMIVILKALLDYTVFLASDFLGFIRLSTGLHF